MPGSWVAIAPAAVHRREEVTASLALGAGFLDQRLCSTMIPALFAQQMRDARHTQDARREVVQLRRPCGRGGGGDCSATPSTVGGGASVSRHGGALYTCASANAAECLGLSRGREVSSARQGMGAGVWEWKRKRHPWAAAIVSAIALAGESGEQEMIHHIQEPLIRSVTLHPSGLGHIGGWAGYLDRGKATTRRGSWDGAGARSFRFGPSTTGERDGRTCSRNTAIPPCPCPSPDRG